MNKKFIALAMVLLLAVGGLFAAVYDLENEDAVISPASVSALLKATIGDYLYHGFVDASASHGFSSTIDDINDAFTIDPVFNYGYDTNIGSTYSFEWRLTVSDFLHNSISGKKIKISDVVVDSLSPLVTDGYYVIMSKTGAETADSVAIKIIPAKATGTDHLGAAIATDEHAGAGNTATSGAYTSTVTITLVAV